MHNNEENRNIIWNGRHFPQAFIDRVNSKRKKDIIAEAVSIDMVVQKKMVIM
jgi:hypothetical protein